MFGRMKLVPPFSLTEGAGTKCKTETDSEEEASVVQVSGGLTKVGVEQPALRGRCAAAEWQAFLSTEVLDQIFLYLGSYSGKHLGMFYLTRHSRDCPEIVECNII